jgi:hypothetical protein
MMNVSRRRVRSAALRVACGLLAAGALSAAAPAARAQALKQVPSDALVVVKINHLSDTNAKVSALLEQMGVVDLVGPQAKDPLKAFTDQTGIPAASLDASRDAAVFVPNVAGGKEEDEEAEQPPVVILLPVSDYKAFIAGLSGAKTEGEVTTGRFKEANEDTFVAHWGDYAALTPQKALLSGKHDGLSPSGAAGRELDQKDFCVYVNFPVLKKVLQPKLAEAKTKAIAEAEGNMGDADAAKKELGKAVIDQGFNVVESFLRDAEPTTIGLSVTKAGVLSNMVVAFTPGSYLGTMFGQMKTTDGPLLGGLPDEKYLFYGGSVQDPKMLAKLIDDLVAPIDAKLSGLGEAGTKIHTLVDLYKAALANSDGGSVGMVVPTAAFGQGSLIRYVAVMHADAEKLKNAQEQMAEMQSGIMASLGVQGQEMMKVSVTKNAKTVDGVSFDAIKTEVDPAANNGQAAQAQQMMQYAFGPDGDVVVVGAVNDHTLVSGLGLDDQLLGSVIEAAKSNKDVLTAGVKAVDAELPKARSAVAYIDLAQFFTTGLSYAHALGMNMPVQLPANLPPIGLSFGTDPDSAAMRFDAFVPASLAQSLVQAGFQIYLTVGHGGGGL